MEKLLFINGCVRGKEVSRTYKIARGYLEEVEQNTNIEIIERNITQVGLRYLSYENFKDSEESTKASIDDQPEHKLAREFASADWIVIAAPFWEFSFPAVLSCYIETISVPGITFKYTNDGSVGLCKAKKLLYISSSGDHLTEDDRIGEKLLGRLAQLYGIPRIETIMAQGLDLWNADPDHIVNESIVEAKNKAKHDFRV